MSLPPASFRFRATAMLACLSALLTGCANGGASDERPLVLIASGDTAGWIVPCGCAANQSGGLLWRGAFLEKLRKTAEPIYVDVGGAPAGATPYDRAKFAAILRGELAMGLAAHNVGEAEARLGADELRSLAKSLGVRWLSANTRTSAGEPLGQPTLVVSRSGKRLAIVGVLDDQLDIPGLELAPPREAVLAALDAVRGPFDAAAVLAYLPEDRLMELAGSLPEVDVVIGGPTGQSISPRRLGPTLVLSATNKGKFLARLQAKGRGKLEWSGEIVEVKSDLIDSLAQQHNLARFRDELARRDFAPLDTPFALPADDRLRIAGTESCRACHAAECAAWQSSAHGHSWESLRARGAHVDPYCQQCHTNAYGQSGGFRSLADADALKSVGCESCHGPSAAHVTDPRTPTTFAGQAADRCLHCHDRENSPQFSYEAYWTRIRHGNSP